MFGAGLLNLGSLILGLIALAFPIVNIAQHNKANHNKVIAFSVISVSACTISLCMQILYTNHLVKIEDWSALMDTSSAVSMISILLLTVTILLNAVVLVMYYKQTFEGRK